jgi:hypothetical protein
MFKVYVAIRNPCVEGLHRGVDNAEIARGLVEIILTVITWRMRGQDGVNGLLG